MTMTAISQDLIPIDLPLAEISLDPNNPRFVTSNWQNVPDSDVPLESVQEGARARLVQGYGIDKLKMSMEVNGYLPIDRVIVRSLSKGGYVVLEGNRRICAAKLVGAVDSEGKDVPMEIRATFANIPCLKYVGQNADAAWVFQGLRHISGIVEWSAYNKAKLLVEQMETEGMSLGEVGRRFGLSPFGAGQWVRGFYAFKQAKQESDYISEVDERSYLFFQEIFSRSSIKVREWLEWSEEDQRFNNALNFNEFVGWIYPKPDGDEADAALGDFEKRRLLRRDDIRALAELLKSDEASFQQFRTGQALPDVLAMAAAKEIQKKAEQDADRVEIVFEAMDSCKKAIEDMPLKIIKNPELLQRFNEKKAALTAVLADL
jgi:hypothetical protein